MYLLDLNVDLLLVVELDFISCEAFDGANSYEYIIEAVPSLSAILYVFFSPHSPLSFLYLLGFLSLAADF